MGYASHCTSSGAVVYWLLVRTHNTSGCELDSSMCHNNNTIVEESNKKPSHKVLSPIKDSELSLAFANLDIQYSMQFRGIFFDRRNGRIPQKFRSRRPETTARSLNWVRRNYISMRAYK